MNCKVLFYDIETTPMRAYIWRTGKQYVNHSQIVKDDCTKIMCIAYKWENKSKIHALTWDNKRQDDEYMIEEFTKIVESADVVIGHNADQFDMKHINTRRLLSGRAPIAWPTSEDSLKQIRAKFKFPSNSLAYVSKLLLGETKSPMGFQDWIDILETGSLQKLTKMVKYCKRDVKLMAKAYALLKPFLSPKASRALFSEQPLLSCPSCGSDGPCPSRGLVTLKTGRYRKRRCDSCGYTFRESKKIK